MAITITELEDFRGEAALRIDTSAAVYVLHRNSGGLAALFDGAGADWIGYSPEPGSTGEFRGIPNLGREGGGFHPGRGGCVSTVISAQAEEVKIDVRSEDDRWRTLWTFSERELRILVNATSHPYWFLYEGTPGGEYREDRCVGTRSDGTTWRCSEKWEARLPDPRRVIFHPEGYQYRLLLEDRAVRDAETVDSFWSLEKNMTVFGFGRLFDHKDPRWMHLTETPAEFVVALERASIDEERSV